MFNNEAKKIAVLSGMSYTKENIKYIDIYTHNLIFRVMDIMQDEECKVSDLAYEAHEARCKRVIKYFEGYLP